MQPADPDPPELARLLAGFSGLLAFDIGANTGATARMLAQRFAHVVALEPCEESYEQLATAAPPNITPRPLAVSDRAAVLELVAQEHAIRSGQLTTAGVHDDWGAVLERRLVAATTVDALTAQHGDPDLLKIDVEGHELRVLHGALKTLHETRPALFVEVHDVRLGRQIRSLLDGWYPGMWRVDHPHYRPGEWRHENHFWLLAPLGG